MKFKNIAVAAAAITTVFTLSGCAAASVPDAGDGDGVESVLPDVTPDIPPEIVVPKPPIQEKPVVPEQPKPEPDNSTVVKPVSNKITYLTVTSDGVNIRSGAGTNYSVVGTAEKHTLYAYLGEQNGWYKTQYKNKTVFISSKYCSFVEMEKSADERVEAVIADGCKYLGTKYVYGAIRYHDGKGNKLKDFTSSAFDCSSLMQYIFYNGASKLLDVTTRTQVVQGKTVSKSQMKRGDLMFFTNESRKNKTGVERIGHVALYMGDNLILHTASDYAKIEQISSTRWSYFIQAQRML